MGYAALHDDRLLSKSPEYAFLCMPHPLPPLDWGAISVPMSVCMPVCLSFCLSVAVCHLHSLSLDLSLSLPLPWSVFVCRLD